MEPNDLYVMVQAFHRGYISGEPSAAECAQHPMGHQYASDEAGLIAALRAAEEVGLKLVRRKPTAEMQNAAVECASRLGRQELGNEWISMWDAALGVAGIEEDSNSE